MNNKILINIFLMTFSFCSFADNEIFVDQTGSNALIDLEQLGSSNIIGGTDSTAGNLSEAVLNGTTMTIDINQIGSSNEFLTGGIYGDNFTGFFEFDGDSNIFDIDIDTDGTNGADFADFNVDITGSSNEFDLDFAETAGVNYLDLDWIIDGDSNIFEFDVDYEYATNYMDILGDSNEITFSGSGYGASSSDAGYFYLDLDGSSNTIDITQSSTLARDWLKLETNAANSNICIVQSDGGSATSC